MNKSPALVILALCALIIALSPAPTHAAPPRQLGGTQVVIINPVNGMTLPAGQTIGIASTSTAPDGIAFVQLFVDNVGITTNSPPGGPTGSYYVVQGWTTTPGYHTITVTASSSRGVPGQTSIFVNVGGGPPPGPTITPNPCVVGSSVVSEGNPPPNSQIQPGTAFQKTWQVQNTGTCIWISSYGIMNVAGGTLSAPSLSGIPNTAPNQTVNLAVNMVAPQQPGTYNSIWRLRAPNGILFGPQMSALIVVPQAGCSGTPQFSSFYASPQTVSQGQQTTLVWGPVYNSDQIKLQTPFGSSPVNAPNQQVVFPTGTSSYILTAFCRGQRQDAAVTVNVTNPPPPTQTPQNNYINLQQAQYAGVGAINVPVQYFYNNQNAPGQIQLFAYNGFGQQVGSSLVGAIPFAPQAPFITMSIPSGYRDAVTIQGCIIDRTGNRLACNAGLGIR